MRSEAQIDPDQAPPSIIDRIDVTLPRPRTYEMMGTETFAKLRDRIWQQIRKAE